MGKSMKSIILTGPTIVGDAVRRPHENPITVSNKEASRLVAAGVLVEDPVDVTGDDPVERDADDANKVGDDH
jgi:hypothetical protein